jgi:hypothetical protein
MGSVRMGDEEDMHAGLQAPTLASSPAILPRNRNLVLAKSEKLRRRDEIKHS